MTATDRPTGCGCYPGFVCRLCQRAGLPPAASCRHRGDELTGHQRHALGLSAARWAVCEHPEKPLGKYVCSCKGCGTKCVGYNPETYEV